MAILLGDAFIRLTTKDDDLNTGLARAQNNVSSWASNLSGKVSALAGGAVLAGVGALAGAVAGIGTAAFTTASEFDTATKKIQSQLGLTEESAGKAREAMEGVFKNNFGDSIADVGEAIADVERNFARIGGTGGADQLQAITEKALGLRDAFDIEVNESTSAAVELMDKFGLSSTQAFDFIASGFQRGLNSSGDFLDSVTEYSTQFANGGADAGQFFSILETGLQGGVLGTDKAADAFKEFRLRINDGSTLTAQSLEALGLNAESITKRLADGSLTTAQVFDLVLDKLRETEDPTLRMQTAVGLLGTQYEDLGDSAVAALDLSKTTIDELAGATEKLNKQYETIPAFFEGLGRRAQVALSPLGEIMLNIVNAALPGIEGFFASIEEKISTATAKAGELFKQVNEGGGGFAAALTAAVGGVTGATVTFDVETKVTTVDWGDFTYEYSATSGITSVDWTNELGSKSNFTYDANAGVVSVDWTSKVDNGGIAFEYSADAGITKVDWNGGDGGFRYTYDADAGITEVDFGIYSYTYDAKAQVTQNNVLWGLFTHTYDAKANISDIEVNTALLGEKLSTLSANFGKGLETVAAGLVINAPQWVQDLVNWKPEQGAPAWVTSLLGFKFPPAPTTITDLLSWAFPGAPTEVSDLLTWAWPDTPTTLDTLFTWVWPEFGAGLVAALERVFSFKWPKIETPAWVSSLLNFQFPTPAWINRLLSWTPPIPAWLGGGGASDPTDSPSFDSGGSIGGDGRTLARAPVYLTVNHWGDINNGQDVEEIAYVIAKRLATA